MRRSWDALSAFDTDEGTRRQARRVPRLGRYSIRNDIPSDCNIIVEQTLGPGHYDIRGDKHELHGYLADFVAHM